MKQKLTPEALERRIDELDQQIAGLPHGNTMLLPDGTSRPMTVRDQFRLFLASLRRRRNPEAPFRLDLDRFVDYWRDCILAQSPPERRPISAQRLNEKGAHNVIIPSLRGPLERAAACHFEFEEILGAHDQCDLHVQRVRQGCGRRTILGKNHRFNPARETLICFGAPEQVQTFIFAQRGQKPERPIGDLEKYLAEVVGLSPGWVQQYTGAHPRS